MMDVGTIELVEGCFYWIKPAYEAADLWTVARWEHGCFWNLKNQEVTPRIISGPIPRPSEASETMPTSDTEKAAPGG